jgi:hypothetical protein
LWLTFDLDFGLGLNRVRVVFIFQAFQRVNVEAWAATVIMPFALHATSSLGQDLAAFHNDHWESAAFQAHAFTDTDSVR